MKFYIRQSEAGDIRGPFDREEIAHQLPREIDRSTYQALAANGFRPENVGHQKGWIPLGALFPKYETTVAKASRSRYTRERAWIDGLSRCVILFFIGTALYQLYIGATMPVAFGAIAWSALGTVCMGCLGALGVRYLIRVLADIADAQHERLERKRDDG